MNDHEALQNRIEDLTAPWEDYAEFVTDYQLLIKHSQLVDNLENLQNMHQMWCVGNRVRHDAESLLITASLNSKACRDSYEKLKVKYNDFAISAHSYLICSDIKSLVNTVDELMKNVLDKASSDLKLKAASSVGGTHSTSTTTPAIPLHRSILKLNLPKFSGDVLDWREFWSIFSARLNRETCLSEHERISCLENAMLDKEAKSIIRLHCASGSYTECECVKALHESYDRNKMVYRHHAEKLLQLKPVQDTYESLCKLLHDITCHSGVMKACGGNTFEQLIVALVVPVLGCGQPLPQRQPHHLVLLI